MRILAIDFGFKRTGLAWTDPLKIIATGIGWIETSALEKKLKELVIQGPVEKIVLGLPMHADGNDTDATSGVRALYKKLQKWFPEHSIVLYDERYTSKMAMRTLIDSGINKKKRQEKGLVDQVSATILLQSYMDTLI